MQNKTSTHWWFHIWSLTFYIIHSVRGLVVVRHICVLLVYMFFFASMLLLLPMCAYIFSNIFVSNFKHSLFLMLVFSVYVCVCACVACLCVVECGTTSTHVWAHVKCPSVHANFQEKHSCSLSPLPIAHKCPFITAKYILRRKRAHTRIQDLPFVPLLTYFITHKLDWTFVFLYPFSSALDIGAIRAAEFIRLQYLEFQFPGFHFSKYSFLNSTMTKVKLFYTF